MQVVIVGGGYTGLAAAYDLNRAGYSVTVLEADEDIGGLAGTFELSPGVRLEKFYHHWFTSDTDILQFLDELGLSSSILYKNSNTGIYFANSIFRLASPLDLLRFTPLPLLDRIRTGVMALVARRIDEWRSLEDISAAQWIISHAGRRSYETMWKPLLVGKFGVEAENVSAVWFWNKLKLRGSSRDKKGGEQLAYFSGSFGAATAAMRGALEKAGVVIRTGTPVTRIAVSDGKVVGVETPQGQIAADIVLATLPLPLFLKMCPELPESFTGPASQIRFLGNVCTVFRLKQSLSSTYWLNVADPSFPFVGIIEHTNFDDPARYNGERIAYLSKYLPTSEPLFKMSDQEVLDYSLPFVQRMFPKFSPDWIIGYKVWRASYSQPVITKGYSKLIPPEQTPIQNLWLSTMAQVYPEDRGTNYAVRAGRKVAQRIIDNQRAQVAMAV